MKGLVLYNKADLEAGPVFAERLIRHGREMGFDMTLARKEDLCRTVREGKLLLLLDGQPLSADFALNRTRDSYLGALLEGQGIRVFNNVQTTFVANDKFSSYNQARKLGIPAVRTERFFPTAEKAPYFPCVIKSASGHGGAEVSLIAGPEDFAAWKASEVGQRRGPSAGCVLQPFVPHAHDVRVFVLGGEILGRVERIPPEGDFRANVKQGGSFCLFEDDRLDEPARKLAASLQSDYVGVDFLVTGGTFLFNELEDVVGSSSLCALKNLDTAQILLQYIAKKIGM